MVYLENFQNIKPKAGTSSNSLKNKNLCRDKLVEFCKRTDMHGYKYIVMEDFSFVERSIWAVAVIASIACAAFFVVTSYKWYARNPIVTVIESTQGPIWDVPFPAVTICDLNIVSRRAARDLANNLTLPDNVTVDFVFKTLRLTPLLYTTFKADPEQKQQLYILQAVLDHNNISIEAMFEQLSPASTCARLIQRCMWKNAVYRCEELFTEIYTLFSICCTFNYYGVEGFEKKTGSELKVPRRVASCGYQTALTVLLYTDADDYYSATVSSQGALVIIDDAYNFPDLDSPVRMVNPATEVLIALSPERTYTTSGVKTFTPEQRQCYYSNEMQLGRFQRYSFHNCMAYQKVQLLIQECGCIIPPYFPTKKLHRPCNFKDMECLDISLRHQNDTVYQTNNQNGTVNLSECLPECEHYDYPLEMALGTLADNMYVNGLPFFDDVSLKNHSLLNVFFNDLVSTRYRRDVYLNWQNILAAFGGLLSLMLGFTIIAGFDVVLFFAVRVPYDYCTDVKQNRQMKVKPSEYKRNGWMDSYPNHKHYYKYNGDLAYEFEKY